MTLGSSWNLPDVPFTNLFSKELQSHKGSSKVSLKSFDEKWAIFH